MTGHSPVVQSFCGHWINGLVARAAPTLAHVRVCPKDFKSQVLPPLVYLASLSISTTIEQEEVPQAGAVGVLVSYSAWIT